VVPLATGKALLPQAWRFSTLDVPDPSAGPGEWWRWLLQSVDDEAWQQLSISRWDLPELELTNQLRIAVSALWAAVSHLAGLLDIPEVPDDSVGETLLLDHVKRYGERLSDALQTLLDRLTDVEEQITGLAGGSLADRTALQEALATLHELRSLARPDGYVGGQMSLTLAQAQEWSEKLRTALLVSTYLGLCWLADASSFR